MTPFVQCSGVGKTYQGKSGAMEALRGIDLECGTGEFVCLLGLSGCGKSTLLQLIAGLEQPTAGTITVNGKPLAGPSPETSIVFQDHGLFPWMTVERNVAFNMKARGVPARERRQVAAEFIAMTGLTAFRDRYPHELSGGMRQRVGIARALTTRPRALLMDEPFGALDAQTRGDLQEELLRIWQQQRSTVVFVTHSIDEAVFLADRIAVFSARPGRIAALVTVDLPRPRDTRAPHFAELSRMLRAQIAPDLHGAPPGMRLLLANPNTSQSVTDRIAAVARAVAAPGTEIVAVTGATGVPYIATRAEAAIAGRTTMELMAEHGAGCDAAIVAAFGDPAVGGAREAMAVPVIGMAEAAMLTACMLGRRFAIVTFATAFAPWYRECVEYNGLIARLAALRILDAPFSGIDTVQAELEAALVALCCRTATEDEADVVILGGAPLAGMARRVADRVPVPLVDGVEAAVLQAEALVRLSPRKPTAGSFRRPAPKPSTGLPPPLTAMLDWTTPPTK